MSHKEQLKKAKQQKRIIDMSSGRILFYLMNKHKVGLLIISNMFTLAILISRYI